MFQSRYREAFHFRGKTQVTISALPVFQSRYREAFHFRASKIEIDDAFISFNLVIERLFISGGAFRCGLRRRRGCFNLVIERLFISGCLSQLGCNPVVDAVSISLSRGFSFQESRQPNSNRPECLPFQSRYREAFHFRHHTQPSTLPTSRFQSRYREAFHFRSESSSESASANCHVSISLSRGFSFQGPARGAPDTLWLNARTSASVHFQRDDAC